MFRLGRRTLALSAAVLVGATLPVASPAAADDGDQSGHGDSFAVSTWDDGSIMHWSTCDRPITWWSDSAGAAGSAVDSGRARTLIADALREASAITGYRFVDGGAVDGSMDTSTLDTINAPPPRSGVTFILGSGTDADTGPTQYRFPVLDGPTLGLTQQVGGPLGSGLVQASRVWLDVHQIGADRAMLRAVITHEIGHVLGLGHVTDDSQLMYPSEGSITTFMAGDRNGLRIPASQPCRFTAPVLTIRSAALTPRKYRISWTRAADFSGAAAGYILQARVRGREWTTIAARLPAHRTSFAWSGARPGHHYQFRVAGYGKGGQGPWSGIVG